MEIRHNAPMTRGVTQLMYVGDDQAVETATAKPDVVELLGGALAAWHALHSKGFVRLASAGIASVVAYRMIKARTVG